MLDKWIDKVNKFIIKSSKILEHRFVDELPTYEPHYWGDSFIPNEDGFALLRAKVTSRDGYLKVTSEFYKDTVVLQTNFGGTADEVIWLPVRGGTRYTLDGEGAKKVDVSFLYFRK